MPRQRSHLGAAGDAAALEVDDHDLAPRGVGQVRVAAVRGDRGVARLGHAAQHPPDSHR
jgi:hypothetical protein